MSQDVDREKVLQTTKVRTPIKSDLSWIQKMKRTKAQDGKESTELAEGETSPSLRQVSYVLMTAKKFESATSPPQTPEELTCPKDPDTSENGLQNGKHSESVSPEPTAASTATEEKKDVEPSMTNDSVEISTKVDVNDTTPVDESVAGTVPDILAGSVFKSPPPQEDSSEVSKANALDILSDNLVEPILNSESKEVSKTNALDILSDSLVEPILNSESKEVSKTNALDILSDSLVEPILKSESKEADVNSSSETEADQNAHDSAATAPNGNTNALNDDEPVTGQHCDEIVEVADLPQDSISSTETLSTLTKVDIVASKTTTTEVSVVQNDAEPTKEEASEEAEVPKEPDVSAISSEANVAQDNTETKETDVSSTKEASGTASAEVGVENNVDTLKTSEETFEVPKEPEIPGIVSDVLQNNAEPEETQTTKEDSAEGGAANGEINVKNDVEPVKVCQAAVEEPKEPEVSATITDVTQDNVEPSETQTTSSKLDIVESETTNAEVTEQKASDVAAVSSDVSVADSGVQPQGLPSTNGETGTAVDDTIAQDDVADQGVTAEVLAETKEAIVDQKPENANSVTDETATNESPENPVEISVIPEKETVIDAKTAEESTVREIIASEEKAQTQTSDDSMMVTENLVITPKENVEDLNKVEVQASIETPESVQSTAKCPSQTSALAEVNQDDIFKAEPVMVESSLESSAAEVVESAPPKNTAPMEETSAVVPSVASENQDDFDISDALDVVPNGEQSKEEEGTVKKTGVNEATADETVIEPKNSSGEQQPMENSSAPGSVEKEETTSNFIMRDGKEVCSHCDQFIGLIKITFSYPPMYLHPDCLTCGVCAKVLGDLLIPMFEHNHVIYCSDCYDKVYTTV